MLKKNNLLVLGLLLLGLALSVYGTLNYQNILSRAGSNDYMNFSVTQTKDGQDVSVICDSNGSCETQSLDVKLQIKNLDELSQ